MSPYLIAFSTHVTCAVISISFFCLRGYWMLRESPLLSHPVVRIAPHLIDTVLLASAIVLSIMLRQYPFVHGWVTVKVIALVGYILLGTVALKRGRTKTIRQMAFVGALVLFGFIVSVAYYHHPLGVLINLF
ncbi:MAG: SirB2 family protein [Pseudomonadales bacterium]